jgi:N-acyl-D-aspartate/D-glutamate deacylase
VTTDDDQDVIRHLVKHVWTVDEQSFVRHLRYNLWFRHGILRMPDAVRSSIWILRLKRAVDRLTPKEREEYGLRDEDHNIHEGWTTKLDRYSYEHANRPQPKGPWSWGSREEA